MSSPDPINFLTDPLSGISRAERRNLLISSVVGFLVSKAGIVPQKISALGIDLSLPAQKMFIYLVGAIIIYFMLAFVVYGMSDFFIWRKKYQDYLDSVETYMDSWSEEDQKASAGTPKIDWLYQKAGSVAYIRAFFEYLLPITVGLTSVVLVFFSAWKP
jgi:hypothetical protein